MRPRQNTLPNFTDSSSGTSNYRAHTSARSRDHKLEVRLDSKRERRWRDRRWRAVKAGNHVRRSLRELGQRHGRERKRRGDHVRERSTVFRRRLSQGGTHVWHCPATILTVMNRWRTAHCVATLHCLFRRKHCAAIGGVHPKSGYQQGHSN